FGLAILTLSHPSGPVGPLGPKKLVTPTTSSGGFSVGSCPVGPTCRPGRGRGGGRWGAVSADRADRRALGVDRLGHRAAACAKLAPFLRGRGATVASGAGSASRAGAGRCAPASAREGSRAFPG